MRRLKKEKRRRRVKIVLHVCSYHTSFHFLRRVRKGQEKNNTQTPHPPRQERKEGGVREN